MNRRESIVRLALLMGGTMVGPRLLRAAENVAAGAAPGASPAALALLDEIGDTIIPATDVPGAKAVKIGEFIAMMVRDCYEPNQQAAFHQGVQELTDRFRTQHGREFLGAPGDLRTKFLNGLDQEQQAYTQGKTKDQPAHYFRLLKELTVLGYFSSEVGCTQAIRYIEVPGSFSGDVPYKTGDRVWFS